MGNCIFKSDCTFNIHLDHEQEGKSLSIVAGNLLQGKVTIRALKSLPPAKVELRLTGKEKSIVKVKKGRSTQTLRADRQLCYAATILRRDDDANAVNAGTHIYPFTFDLPSSLPTSMQAGRDYSKDSFWARHSEGSCCRIIYKLKLDVTPQGRTSPIRALAERPFGVASCPLPSTRVPASIAPQSIQVKSLGGTIHRGHMSIAAKVLDVHVGRGSNLEIFLACRNDASASIYQVEVRLVETVIWKSESNCREETRTMATLNDVELPAILRGKRDKGMLREQIRQGGVPPDELAFLNQELESERNKVTLQVPNACRDTYAGSLIQVSHVLQITTYTRCLISNPTVQIQLRIGYPPVCPPPNHEAEAFTFGTSTQHPSMTAIPERFSSSEYAAAPAPMPYPMAEAEQFSSSKPELGIYPQASVPTLPDVTVPMADAVVISPDENTIEAPVASAPPEAMILGGLPTYQDVDISLTEGISPMIPPGTAQSTSENGPSLESLLQEMIISIDDFDIITAKLQQGEWRNMLAEISSDEFGSILAHIHRDSDQPRIAQAIARHALRDRFSCEYGRAAIQNCAEWNRTTMIKNILPYCVDRTTNYQLIQDELTDWELAVTLSDFERWIRG